MKSIIRCIFFPLFAFMLLVSCSGNSNPSRAPNFTLLDLEDHVVKLSNFRGKVVLLNFFATYCPACRYEIPGFVRLQDEFGPKGFQVIGVSVDENGEEILPYFIGQMGINYPVLLATSKVIRDYGNIYALPQSFLIDRNQTIIEHYTGMITEKELKPVIEKALFRKVAKK